MLIVVGRAASVGVAAWLVCALGCAPRAGLPGAVGPADRGAAGAGAGRVVERFRAVLAIADRFGDQDSRADLAALVTEHAQTRSARPAAEDALAAEAEYRLLTQDERQWAARAGEHMAPPGEQALVARMVAERRIAAALVVGFRSLSERDTAPWSRRAEFAAGRVLDHLARVLRGLVTTYAKTSRATRSVTVIDVWTRHADAIECMAAASFAAVASDTLVGGAAVRALRALDAGHLGDATGRCRSLRVGGHRGAKGRVQRAAVVRHP